jgi:hypothetical protein
MPDRIPDRIDAAIDGAVREMLDVEPPADLRARVIQGIDGGHRSGGSRIAAAPRWVFGSLAAAAIVVLAVLVARRSEPPPQPRVAAVNRHLASPRLVPAVAPDRPAQAAATARRPVPRAETAGTVAAASFSENAGETPGIAPLKAIAPIAVAPITQETIAPAEIAVRPLNTITDVQIAPLTPPDRR